MSTRTPKGGTVKPNPTAKQVSKARAASGLTQADAAILIYASERTWQEWESGKNRMHPGLFELFNLKVLSLKAAGGQA